MAVWFDGFLQRNDNNNIMLYARSTRVEFVHYPDMNLSRKDSNQHDSKLEFGKDGRANKLFLYCSLTSTT